MASFPHFLSVNHVAARAQAICQCGWREKINGYFELRLERLAFVFLKEIGFTEDWTVKSFDIGMVARKPFPDF